MNTCTYLPASGWGIMTSHRSGETEDNYIADLAVGLCTGQIKTGTPLCRVADFTTLFPTTSFLTRSHNTPVHTTPSHLIPHLLIKYTLSTQVLLADLNDLPNTTNCSVSKRNLAPKHHTLA